MYITSFSVKNGRLRVGSEGLPLHTLKRRPLRVIWLDKGYENELFIGGCETTAGVTRHPYGVRVSTQKKAIKYKTAFCILSPCVSEIVTPVYYT